MTTTTRVSRSRQYPRRSTSYLCMTPEDSTPFIPGAGQCSIQARHLPETLNHAARRNQRHDRATLASTSNKPREQAEPLCVDVIYARQIERHVGWYGGWYGRLHVRVPEELVGTMAQNQPPACLYDDALCLAE